MTQENNILYEVITSYEFQEWILGYHNILDFWSAKNVHHNPCHMIMNSLYLLKFLVEWFFDMERSVMPLIQRKKILKDFKNHKLKCTMKYNSLYKVFYSFLNVNFWYKYLSSISSRIFLKMFSLTIWLVQYNVFYYNVYGLLF